MVSRTPPRTNVPFSDKNESESIAGSSGAKKERDVIQAFQGATADYTVALVRISSRLQERLQAAFEELTQVAFPTASSHATDEMSNSYRDLLITYQNQDWEKIKLAQTAYLSRIQAQYGDAEVAVRNQLNGYTNAVQAAWEDAKSDSLTALQKHVGAVKDSFANLPVENADPATLAIIAQSLAVVASYAHRAAQAAAAGSSRLKT